MFFSVSRFLLQIFVEAKCHDWWFILSLVLRDSTSLTDFIDDVIKLRDTTAESLSRMKDGIESLEAWAEQNWWVSTIIFKSNFVFALYFVLYIPSWNIGGEGGGEGRETYGWRLVMINGPWGLPSLQIDREPDYFPFGATKPSEKALSLVSLFF